MEKSSPQQSISENITKAILFIVCAIPGAFISLFSSVIFLDSIDGKAYSIIGRLSIGSLSLIAFIIGSFLLIAGLGKIKKPAYLLVFWSFSLLIILPVILIEILPKNFSNFLGAVLGAVFIPSIFIVPFLVKRRVDKFYEKRLI